MRALITTSVQAAEAGDTATLRARISDRYADGAGNDRRAIEGLLRLYVLQHRPLYIYARIPNVHIESKDRAQAVVYAAMAGERIGEPTQLARLRASLYRFDLGFGLEQGEWRLLTAAWRPAELTEFY